MASPNNKALYVGIELGVTKLAGELPRAKVMGEIRTLRQGFQAKLAGVLREFRRDGAGALGQSWWARLYGEGLVLWKSHEQGTIRTENVREDVKKLLHVYRDLARE